MAVSWFGLITAGLSKEILQYLFLLNGIAMTDAPFFTSPVAPVRAHARRDPLLLVHRDRPPLSSATRPSLPPATSFWPFLLLC
ncbi:MAG: hypothetical protein MZV63_41310 [Marinilabiliales bacterium]|nr:hypothetical protein [Marinilabiliales bacterium]